MQPVLFDAIPRYTVTDLTRRVRTLLESAPDLQQVWVQGEISNFSRPASGHAYFTLKDPSAQLRCVMWRNDVTRLKFPPRDGMLVEAFGSVSLYEAGGQYQFYATLLRPLGEGALFAEFLRLKAVLEAEGLFDPARKRLIPELPRMIGVVTSPTGAALRDILNTIRRRNPLTEVIVAPTLVQGEEAPTAIVEALINLNLSCTPDVILLARGGGSIEDLWAFNDERVVRAVVASPAPVITGVGHETDFTLVDFASDMRAPTPTAAAEMATPVTLADLQSSLQVIEQSLVNEMKKLIMRKRESLEWFRERLRLVSPGRLVQGERQRLDVASNRLLVVQNHNLQMASTRLSGIQDRLASLNPLAVLQRGYAIVSRKLDGRIVTGRSLVHPRDEILIRLQDGEFGAKVLEE